MQNEKLYAAKVKHFQREEVLLAIAYEEFKEKDMVLMHRPDKRWCLGYILETFVIKKHDENISDFDFEIVGKIDRTKYNRAIKTRIKLHKSQKIFKKNLCTDDEIAYLLENDIIVPI